MIRAGGSERPSPDYPAYFQDRGEHGSVTFLITVDQSGLVTDVKVAHSSGFPDLDEYALKHIKKRWIISNRRTAISFSKRPSISCAMRTPLQILIIKQTKTEIPKP